MCKPSVMFLFPWFKRKKTVFVSEQAVTVLDQILCQQKSCHKLFWNRDLKFCVSQFPDWFLIFSRGIMGVSSIHIWIHVRILMLNLHLITLWFSEFWPYIEDPIFGVKISPCLHAVSWQLGQTTCILSS